MNARAQVDESARTPLFTKVWPYGVLGGALAFGLYQVGGDFAWLAPIAVAVGGYWSERRHGAGFGRSGLAGVLIALSSFATVLVISFFVVVLFGL
jgi:hypothetical protein